MHRDGPLVAFVSIGSEPQAGTEFESSDVTIRDNS